jgi:hypothetical protein
MTMIAMVMLPDILVVVGRVGWMELLVGLGVDVWVVDYVPRGEGELFVGWDSDPGEAREL